MKRITLCAMLAAAALAAACSSEPRQYGQCAKPTTRDAGNGVVVPACNEWIFGPTEGQKREFDARHPKQ